MPLITLRVSEASLKELQKHADNNKLTLSDYLLSKSLPKYMDEILTVDKVINQLSTKMIGDTFSIKDLFSISEWSNFPIGSRISTGRLFFQAYDQNQFNLRSKVKFLGKNSANLAIYEKLSN